MELLWDIKEGSSEVAGNAPGLAFNDCGKVLGTVLSETSILWFWSGDF